MSSFLSDCESTDNDIGVLNRWRGENFMADKKIELDNFSEKFSERRKLITDELQRILNLTPNSYDTLLHRIESKQSYSASQNHANFEGEPLQIRCDPVILKDPTEENENTVQPIQQIKRPYLKRGSGLARFHMNKVDFQKPPKIYQKKEFRSYLKGECRPPSTSARKTESGIRQTMQVPVRTARSASGVSSIAEKPIVKTFMRPTSTFDEEYIPTARNLIKTQKIESSKGSQTAPKEIKIPKTPMKKLTLKHPHVTDSQRLDQQIEKENRNFEMLEKRVEESDFCSQNSSIQKLVNDLPFSSHRKPRRLIYEENVEKEDMESGCEEGDDETVVDRPVKLKSFSEHEMALRVKRKALQDNVKKIFECNFNHRGKGTVVRRLVKKVRIKKPMKSPRVEKVNLRALKERLEELEKEKSAFQRENNKLKRIQKELYDEKIKLEKQRKEDEKTLKEEYSKLMLEKEAMLESQKKLLRDKVVFEKYCKDSKNVPSREERDELRKVKDELDKLKELLSTKEARWGSSQARLRNQLKNLETENKHIKKELEEAKKLTVKKVTFDSQQSINTRVINAINTQLGKRLTGIRSSGSETAREPKPPKSKPLRRVKSAADIQVARKNAETPVNSKSNSITLDTDDGESNEEQVNAEETEIINLFSPASPLKETSKRSASDDSGFGSRPCESENFAEETNRDLLLKGSLQDDGCKGDCPSSCSLSSAMSSKSALSELTQRIRSLVEIAEGRPSGDAYLQKNCCISMPRSTTCCQFSNVAYDNDPAKATLEEPINRRILPNGDKEETFANGKKLLVSNSGDFIRVVYSNGDIREKYLRSLREKYFYKESGVWQTTFTDRPGYQQLEMPDGRTVVYHPDGNVDTLYPNGAIARLKRSGTQEWRFKTGEVVRTDSNGNKILMFPDGRREFTSKDFKRLEDIDGTVKTVYKDGRQETKYPNGRVRVKDKHGNLIMNTAGFTL